jgi:hypothetical protein
MENKYYTPSIEEFRVGFKIEVYNPDKKDWEDLTVEIGYCYGEFSNWISWGEVRVKYLNREDIESEDFNYEPINGEKDVMLFNSNRKDSRGKKVNLIYNPKSNWLLVSTGEWSITVWEKYNSYSFNPTFFAGTIKNLSEFRKILKQLNIDEK